MDPFLFALRVMGNSRKPGTGKVEMGREIDVLLVEERSVDAEVTLSALRRGATREATVLRLRDGNEALRYLFSVGAVAIKKNGMPGLVLLVSSLKPAVRRGRPDS